MLRYRDFIDEESLSEMSVEKLRTYASKARQDYRDKIKTNVLKSIDRAKHVQKAEVKIYNKVHEDAVPANNVGGGKIAGAGIGPQGEPGVKKKRNPRLVNSVLQRKPA